MIQWAKFASKAKKIGSKAKGAAKTNLTKAKAFTIKGKVKAASVLNKAPLTKGLGKGLKYGTFGVGALAVGSGAYDLATGKRSVKLKKSDPNYKALKRAGYI